MVRNLPLQWHPVDLYDSFSHYGKVAGAFIFQQPKDDAKAMRCGLVEMMLHQKAYGLCLKQYFHTTSAVMSLEPTDIDNLAEWLGISETEANQAFLASPPRAKFDQSLMGKNRVRIVYREALMSSQS